VHCDKNAQNNERPESCEMIFSSNFFPSVPSPARISINYKESELKAKDKRNILSYNGNDQHKFHWLAPFAALDNNNKQQQQATN